eukprot:8457905-Pyramimonas_sp.AAC.1
MRDLPGPCLEAEPSRPGQRRCLQRRCPASAALRTWANMGEARAARGRRSPRRDARTLESTPEARPRGGEKSRTACRAS